MESSQLPPQKKLHLKLISYERPLKQPKLFNALYFSLRFLGVEYFSSEMPLSDLDGRLTNDINDHFVYVLDADTPSTELLEIIRWEDHVPIFTFSIQLSEVQAKQFCQKRIETKPQDYINITISLLEDHELLLLDRKTNEIAHYYSIDYIEWKSNKESTTQITSITAPSYITIVAGKKKYTFPEQLSSKCVVLQLPCHLIFQYYQSGRLTANSQALDSHDFLKKSTKVNMFDSNTCVGSLNFEGQWGYNLSSHSQLNMLSDTYQLMIYDFEIVFEKENQYPDTKLKLICGNKLFEMTADNYNGKKMRFKKLIHLFLKTEDEQITFKLEKNHIQYSNIRLITQELQVHETIKKKLCDCNTGKQMGTIRFKSEKAKSLTLPENNKLWRESLKKQINYNYIVSIEQVSYYLQPNTQQSATDTLPRLKFHAALGNNDITIQDAICLSKYSPQSVEAHRNQKMNLFNVREESALYLIFQKQDKQPEEEKDDVEGMAVIDIGELRLSLNSLQVPLYKNQNVASYVNLLINKVPNLQICKSDYQPEILGRLKKKTRNVSVEVSSALMNSYFYTYEYQNKNELYCIVEINRVKKVLLLEKQQQGQLMFVQGEGSDYLNFVVEETEYLRVKLTFLIADLGFEEEIYGSVIFKCRFVDLLSSGNISFARTNIKNDFEIVVGSVSARLIMGDLNRKNAEVEMRQLKNQMARVNQKVKQADNSLNDAKAQGDRNLSMDNGPSRYASIDAIDNIKSDRYSRKEPSISGVITKKRYDSLSVKLPALTQKAPTNKKGLKSIKQLVAHVKSAHLDKSQVKEMPKDEEEGMDDTIQKLQKEVQKNRKIFAMNRVPRQKKSLAANDSQAPKLLAANAKSKPKQQLFDPTIQKNFDILFPGRFNKMKKVDLQLQINQYEQQLKGLKSILNHIDKDIPDVEAEVHQSRSPIKPSVPPASNHQAEFEDNEFMAMEGTAANQL